MRIPVRAFPALLVIPALGAWLGGWAVTTVDDLPDHVEAGKAFTLSYVVRQHGVERLSGLRGRIEASSGDAHVKAEAIGGREGRYSASITLPRPGDWTLVIHNGFGREKVKLIPMRATAPGASATVLSAAARGERLFVAKGCVTCHVDIDAAPRLVGRRFDSSYLAQFLADPKPTANLGRDQSPMPNLGLKGPEIASLVSYLQGGSTSSTGGK